MAPPIPVRAGPGAALVVLLGLALLPLAVAGCATSALMPLDGPALGPELAAQERELWELTRAHEAAIESEGRLFRDPELERYLADRVLELAGERFAGGVQPSVRVVAALEPNAAAYPHGTIMVTTGLLFAARTEAELAMALAHELAHFRLRHGLRALRAGRRNSAIGTALGVVSMAALAAATGVVAPDLIASGAAYSALATRGYGRELEREADAEGLELLVDAGYDPVAGVLLLERLSEGGGADEAPSTLWSTHPAVAERVAEVQTRAAELARRFEPALSLVRHRARRYRQATWRALLFDAQLELERGEFERARAVVERVLEAAPRSAPALLMAAEVERRSAPDGPDLEAQIRAYQRAAEADPSLAAPHLELALLQRRMGRVAEALASFEAYLERAPAEGPLRAIASGYAERLRARVDLLLPVVPRPRPQLAPAPDARPAPGTRP